MKSATSGKINTEDLDCGLLELRNMPTIMARTMAHGRTPQRIVTAEPLTHCWDKVGVIMGSGKNWNYKVRLSSGCVTAVSCVPYQTLVLTPAPYPCGPMLERKVFIRA